MKLTHLGTGILFFLLAICSKTVNGQTVLERISVAERSDGLGYVTRFHLSAPVDSFTFAHTDLNYIQVKLSRSNLEYDNYRPPESEIINKTIINDIDQETVGIEIYLNPSYLFVTNLYPDANGTDLLLSLTTANEEVVLSSVSDYPYLFEPAGQASAEASTGQEEPPETIDSGVDETGQERSEKSDSSFQDGSAPAAPNSSATDDRVNIYSRADNSFSPEDEYYQRLMQIVGIYDHASSYNLRPVRRVSETEVSHPWKDLYGESVSAGTDKTEMFKPTIKPYQASLFQSVNSTVPRGNNDGAVWQGKGQNIAFSAGFEAKAGPVTLRFRPVIGTAQNISFDLGPLPPPEIRYPEIEYSAPGSIYAYRTFRARIDHVQRYGDSRYSWIDLGESAIEVNYRSLRLALSNEKIWTGPAQNTSLLLGYSAPGFQHLYVGTNSPAKTFMGSFEFAYIFGRMVKSDYFDNIDYRNSQSINAFLLSYSPWFANNRFSIGFLRSYFFPYPKSFDEYQKQASKLYETPLKDSRGYIDDVGAVNDNQMAIVFTRYFVPEHGFDMYLEYGRNDHSADFRDLLGQPSHHRAYTVGMTKAGRLSNNRLVAVNLEINQLEPTRTTVTRGGQTIFNTFQGGWYGHSNQIMGVAHRGQMPGTGYGTGINMQQIKGDLYHPGGKFGVKLARIAYHNAYLNENFDQILEFNDEDTERWEVRKTEFLVGVNASIFSSKNIEISGAIEQSITLNNHYISGNDINNTRFELIIKTKFDGWKR